MVYNVVESINVCQLFCGLSSALRSVSISAFDQVKLLWAASPHDQLQYECKYLHMYCT